MKATLRLASDIFMLLMLSMAVVLVIVIHHINPDKNNDMVASAHQGNLIVELFWDDTSIADVDLWVKAPGEPPVGFTNRSGQTFNLLRDDLGSFADISERNMEIAYGRGLPDGEYIINVQLYNGKGASLPLEALVVVTEQSNDGKVSKKLYSVKKEFSKQKQMETMGNFYVEDGKFVPESLSFKYKAIR